MLKLIRQYKYYLIVPALLLIAAMGLLLFAGADSGPFRYFQ